MGALIKVCPAGKLKLGSKFSRVVTMWLVYSSLYGERRVEMLNLYDISRTVVTGSKHCPVNVRTLDFTRCVVALPACICFACVSSFDAGCDP